MDSPEAALLFTIAALLLMPALGLIGMLIWGF